MRTIPDRFDPVKYSLQECEFLLKHLGEPSFEALRDVKAAPLLNPARNAAGHVIDRNPTYYPDGVIPSSVKPILDRVHELIELERRNVLRWVGLTAIKNCIQTYLDQQEKWIADKKRFPAAPRFPSMSSYDGKNRPHRGGPGSDSGQVHTYFDNQGNRIPFALDLLSAKASGAWVPEWAAQPEPEKASVSIPASATKAIIDDAPNHRLECPVCRHTESYRIDSRSSFNAARGRMSKHLRTMTTETALHRELYTNEFGD